MHGVRNSGDRRVCSKVMCQFLLGPCNAKTIKINVLGKRRYH
jgi:hypothetical protein